MGFDKWIIALKMLGVLGNPSDKKIREIDELKVYIKKARVEHGLFDKKMVKNVEMLEELVKGIESYLPKNGELSLVK